MSHISNRDFEPSNRYNAYKNVKVEHVIASYRQNAANAQATKLAKHLASIGTAYIPSTSLVDNETDALTSVSFIKLLQRGPSVITDEFDELSSQPWNQFMSLVLMV